MGATLHEQMTELRAAGDRRVSLAKTADIVMNGLQSEVFMGIRIFYELEILSDAINTLRPELSSRSLEDIRNEHIITLAGVADAVSLATASAPRVEKEAASQDDMDKLLASFD